jgi:hypothetical protein
MTNIEIEKFKSDLDTVLKGLKNENTRLIERHLFILGNGIKELQKLANRVGAREYIGAELSDMDSILSHIEQKGTEDWMISDVKDKVAIYENICKEISDNITYKLHTEMMLNACVSAENSSELARKSCRWAAIAAIAACIGTIITWWPSISKVLGRYF